jgi:hypothetical protein
MAAVSILADVTTLRILLAAVEPGCINLLHSVDGDTINPVLWDKYPVVDAPFTTLGGLLKAPLESWCEYHLDVANKRVVHLPQGLTSEIRSRAQLFQAKSEVMTSISYNINRSRRKLVLPVMYEDTLRAIKMAQALRYRSSGYDVSKMDECVFVWQYADVHGITPQEAADRLIIEAEFFEAELWKSEGIKMKYWKILLGIQDQAKLGQVMEDFSREFYINAKI